MSIAVLNFKDLTIPNHTKENINFPCPIPTIADITTSVDLLESLYSAAQNRDHICVTKMNRQEKKHYALMMHYVEYVQAESGGDEIKIISTTLDVKKLGGKSNVLHAVANLRQMKGGNEGEVRMRWKMLRGARSYVSQTSTSWNKGWRYTDYAGTKSTLLIGKLVHESYMWVRIAGINSMGIGAWSEPVRVKVG